MDTRLSLSPPTESLGTRLIVDVPLPGCCWCSLCWRIWVQLEAAGTQSHEQGMSEECTVYGMNSLTWKLCMGWTLSHGSGVWDELSHMEVVYMVKCLTLWTVRWYWLCGWWEENPCARSTYSEGSHVEFNRGGTEDEPSEQLLVPHSHICSHQPTLEG